MGILLLLLKCIGILLLALLVFLLLVVLIVLCIPIRYACSAEKTTTYHMQAEVRWLFSRLCLHGETGQEWQTEIFLFGKPLDAWKKKKRNKRSSKKKQETMLTVREKAVKNTEKDTEKNTESKQTPKEIQKPTSDTSHHAEVSERPPMQKREEPQVVQQKAVESETVKQKQPKQPKQPKQSKQSAQPKQGIRRVKLSEIKEEPPQKEDLWEEDASFFTGEPQETQEKEAEGFSWKKTLLQIEDKKGICKAVIRLLRRLAKGILPHQLAFRGTLGTGDPVMTGYLLAVFGILKGKFGKNLVVRGDFSRMCAEDLSISVKGKIVLGYLCYAMAAFVLTKPVRHLIQILWKGRKQNGESI